MIFFKQKHLSFLVIVLLISACIPMLADAQSKKSVRIQNKIQELESSSGGRIGISAINTGNNESIQYRADERFPFYSTSKILTVSAILRKNMADSQYLKQKIFYKKENLVDYSPITVKHLATGMTISELCDATIRYSDNTANNLLIKKLGGLNEVNKFARSIGDRIFRLDRWEPKLNTAIPDDFRDTTTPSAMAKDLRIIIFGNFLGSPERELLLKWLKYNTTGNNRIRAGVPAGWDVSDKTGTGDYGTTNDIGVIWPPKCPPIVVAIYFTQNKKDAPPREEVIANATRILVNSFSENDTCLNPYSSLSPTAGWMKSLNKGWYLQRWNGKQIVKYKGPVGF